MRFMVDFLLPNFSVVLLFYLTWNYKNKCRRKLEKSSEFDTEESNSLADLYY